MAASELIELFGKLLNGPRLAFGALCLAASFAFELRWWQRAIVFFGALLIWDSSVALRKWLVDRRKKHREKKAEELQIEQRQEGAFDALPNEARLSLLETVLGGFERVSVEPHSPLDQALAVSPLVTFLGRTTGEILDLAGVNEYRIEDWGIQQLRQELEQLERENPARFSDLQRNVERRLRPR